MVDGFRAEVQSQLNDLAELMHEFPACRDALGADGGPDVVQAFRDFVAERSAVVGAQMERIATLEAENAELRAIMADAGASSRLANVCPSPAVCQQGCADLRADAERWRFFRASMGSYYREPPMNAATGNVVANEDWFWHLTIRLPNRALFDQAVNDAIDAAREGKA